MLIGILQLELNIGDAANLRDKRRILNSLRDKWHHHHNVSVAESDEYADDPQHALVGVVLAGSDARHMESSLAKIVEHAKHERYAELLDFRIEIVAGHD